MDHAVDQPAGVQVEPGHRVDIVHRNGAVVIDEQRPASRGQQPRPLQPPLPDMPDMPARLAVWQPPSQ